MSDQPNNHEVTFLPSGKTVSVEEGENLLTVARREGLYVKSSCGGHASCGDCVSIVKEGADNLNTPTFDETKLIGNVFHITKERLLCQTMVTGAASVDIGAHDKSTDANKIKTKKFQAPPKGTVRKRTKEEVESIKEERHQQFKDKKEKRENWHKFWEKEQDPMKKGRTGGNKRPKPFIIPEKEEEVEKVEVEKKEEGEE